MNFKNFEVFWLHNVGKIPFGFFEHIKPDDKNDCHGGQRYGQQKPINRLSS
jgi:hypothetical protein